MQVQTCVAVSALLPVHIDTFLSHEEIGFAVGTLYAFLNVAAGLIFYRLYDPRVSTRADLVKVLAHLAAICGASVGANHL